MINISLSSKQLKTLITILEKYEDYIFFRHDLHRDEDYHPYYYDDYSGKYINSDDLVQEVVDLDSLLHNLGRVSLETKL